MNPVADLPALKRLCNHPNVLTKFADRTKRNTTKAQKIVGNSEIKYSDSDSDEPFTSDAELDENVAESTTEWWKPIFGGDKQELSGKMLILFSILSLCEARGEKLLVFSSCLSTLDIIEDFLATKTSETWTRDIDYLRLDGTDNVDKRKRDITRFNNERNKRARYLKMVTYRAHYQ